MKNLIKIEYVFLFILGIIAYRETEKSWWLFAALFFTPDISMIGYLVNSKIGAWIYNFFHHYALAIITYLIAKATKQEWMEIAGIILFTHISFDRILGYGLKYSDSFHNTHIGIIGKNNGIK
jgi:hypothetical protein